MVFGAGLRMKPLPDSMIGTQARTACHSGKFHGMTPRMVPIGR